MGTQPGYEIRLDATALMRLCCYTVPIAFRQPMHHKISPDGRTGVKTVLYYPPLQSLEH